MGGKGWLACILCGGTDFRIRLTCGEMRESLLNAQSYNPEARTHTWGCQVLSCTRCGLAFRKDLPVFDDHARLSDYSPLLKGDFSHLQSARDPFERCISLHVSLEEIEEIGRFRSPPGALLNVGGDCTDILETARLSGWNSASVAQLEAELQPEAKSCIAEMSTSPRFDIVRLEGSLEKAADPYAFLEKAAQNLRQDGLLVISTPDCRGWDIPIYGEGASLWPFDLPRWFFTPQTLKWLLIRVGFRVLQLSTFKLAFKWPTGDFAFGAGPQTAEPGAAVVDSYCPSLQQFPYFRIFARREEKKLYHPVRRRKRNFLSAERSALLEPA